MALTTMVDQRKTKSMKDDSFMRPTIAPDMMAGVTMANAPWKITCAKPGIVAASAVAPRRHSLNADQASVPSPATKVSPACVCM
jgi:hypothetical protein